MNHFTVPKWNQRQQRQEQLAAEEQGNTSCDHVPKSGYEVAELTWENGQLAMHDLSRKWAGDTLECIVDQATRDRPNQNPVENLNSLAAPWDGKQSKKSSRNIVASSSGNERTLVKKRTRAESEQNGSACASASATFCRDNTDTTMMTWTSFEPPQSFKSARIGDDDSSLHTCSEKQDEQGGSKSDDGTGSRSSKRHSRAADKHNQSERRRRDRINQKMKALQKLVPNANKSDKASMLDEVIAYLKQLQAQVQMMSASARTMMMMPQSRTMMMMPQSQPLLTQQHLQMSLLARLGMGMGMGMNNIAHHQPIPSYLHSPFVAPPNRPSLPFNDPYCTFLAQQSMNMDFYNKMEALYQQRINKSLQEQVSSTLTNNVQQGG